MSKLDVLEEKITKVKDALLTVEKSLECDKRAMTDIMNHIRSLYNHIIDTNNRLHNLELRSVRTDNQIKLVKSSDIDIDKSKANISWNKKYREGYNKGCIKSYKDKDSDDYIAKVIDTAYKCDLNCKRCDPRWCDYV